MTEEIRAALARGATVLTGRARAARALRQAVDEAHRAAGMAGWEPARVFAWDSWTAGLWREMLLRGDVAEMLLNRTQEAALWREVVEADRGVATLRSVGSLAGMAAEAWGEMARYRGLGRLAGTAGNGDMEAFARWAAGFEERCREQGYVAQAGLEGALRRAWRGRPERLVGERELLLVGFERMLPAQTGLLEDLRGAGCVVVEAAAGVMAERRGLMAAGDDAGELRAAAEWAREALEERPDASVGVLVPGLKGSAELRAGIDRVFREVLAPEGRRVSGRALPYEFSTGVGLDRTEIGRVALAVLEWAGGALALERVGEMLLSGHFAGGTERGMRAEFEAFEMRQGAMLRPEMGLDRLVGRVEGSKRRMPELLACLRRMQAVATRSLGGEKAYADWAGVMRDLLLAAGWAGQGDSLSFQAREAWEGVLDEMATLDFAGGRVGFARAVRAVAEIARETVFAAESRGAAVQVMGPEEAAGLRFDAVWFLGAGERSWPVVAVGSPLVAWELRRELGMPGTDEARDARQARRVTEGIARSCGEIVFSYARQAGEEQERQRASAALAGLGLREAEAEARSLPGRAVELEVVEDVGRLPVLAEGLVMGGVGVLKAQAACAFHAFAEYRLFATETEGRELGMNASERGRAVHGMLEEFWAEVETQAALKGLSGEARRELLGRAVETTLGKMKFEAGTIWDGAYLETQRERLMRLGMAWLAQEEGRAVAFRVAGRESEREVAVGPLRLKVRLDRVDATDEGAVLIDYKTGSVGAGAWLGERPDEPQLPLYAALAGEMELHAVAFGLVRAGTEMGLTGYAEEAGTLTRAAKMQAGSLAEQVEEWRRVVEGLAEGFAGGDARVSPKEYPGTCQYCAHRLICRLDVPSLGAEGEDEDGGDGDLG